jgi:hypothetical protein
MYEGRFNLRLYRNGVAEPLGRVMKSLILLLALLGLIAGCSGVQTFPNRVAPGETVAVAAGWKQHFSRDNITATITPRGLAPISIPPGDVRASINLYPDPLSSIVLSQSTGSDVSDYSQVYGDLVNINFTGDDRDWWQTVVFVDIPVAGVPTGPADITITNPEGESIAAAVQVVDPDPVVGGAAASFNAELAGPLDNTHLASLERIDHYVVSFSGSVLPYALQIDLDYSADMTGYVVNPKGALKNVSWTDNGGTYRVLLMPSNQQQHFRTMNDFKFYVAIVAGTEGVADLSVRPGSVLAFDQDGAPVTGGVNASVVLVRGAAGLN